MRPLTVTAQPEWAQGYQAVQWPTGSVVVSYSIKRNAFTNHAYWKPDWFNYNSPDSDDLFLLLATPVNRCPSKGLKPEGLGNSRKLTGRQAYKNFCRNTNQKFNWDRLFTDQKIAWRELAQCLN